MNLKRLGIYLNDHLMGSTVGVDLARRTEQENRSNPVGTYLSTLIPLLEQDRATLLAVMSSLEVKPDPLKVGGAWVVEKLSRLKLNGSWLRYSPLSRLVELEGLCVGSHGRVSMWKSLEKVAAKEPRLARFDFAFLAERAEGQLLTLQNLRLRATEAAFMDASVETGEDIPVPTEA
ncbi:hypothetical protein G4177_31355 [Corallococcus sp. ZKHCc1 1396]|uniref:Uncharacterized protein n=1 Tax=Corallococcus soli TaxID=2710757 RepID=A0ABR9PXK6_9BACT|nr:MULTISPECIES: hypothetical protein [Corallococcus]MBE4752666.1 hypothetical protein [Corallococcus soli]MCY1034506.1 hypothetical protein [Corallococcus sp. BB11-1]